MPQLKIYLAGPMSDLPDNNYPAFNDMARKLRAYGGLTVLNPAENAAPSDPSWVNWMRLSFKQVADADAIVLLKGWSDSAGAKAELQMARVLKLPVLYEVYGLEFELPLLIAGKFPLR